MNETVAKRYARALFLIALERNIIAEVSKELVFLSELLADSNTYNFFKTRQVSNIKKKEIITSVSSSLSELTVNLFMLLIDKRRIDLFSLIKAKFYWFVNKNNNIATATIYSAWELPVETIEKIERQFSKLVSEERLHITESRTEPSLLGGVRVHVGNIVIDSSLNFQLSNVEKKIIKQKRYLII